MHHLCGHKQMIVRYRHSESAIHLLKKKVLSCMRRSSVLPEANIYMRRTAGKQKSLAADQFARNITRLVYNIWFSISIWKKKKLKTILKSHQAS